MPSNDTIQDSGHRRTFQGGAVRDIQSGKGRFDLLSPMALRRLARHTENGMKKYGARNWEKGIPISSFIDSAIRHILDYWEGKTDEDHLAAAFWNLHGAIHTEEAIERRLLPSELGEKPDYTPKKHGKNRK